MLVARHVAVRGDVADPRGAPEGVRAAGQAAAGGDRHPARDVGEGRDAGAGRGVVPDRRAAQHARLVVRAPDCAVGPAEGLAERGEHAHAELVGRQAGRHVVGDLLLGQQQQVRVMRVRARVARRREHLLEHARHARRVGSDDRVGPEALHEGGEVARAQQTARRRRTRAGGRPSAPAPWPCAPAPGRLPRPRRSRRPSRVARARPRARRCPPPARRARTSRRPSARRGSPPDAAARRRAALL